MMAFVLRSPQRWGDCLKCIDTLKSLSDLPSLELSWCNLRLCLKQLAAGDFHIACNHTLFCVTLRQLPHLCCGVQGFAYVEFGSKEALEAAIGKSGTLLNGRHIDVVESKPQGNAAAWAGFRGFRVLISGSTQNNVINGNPIEISPK